jgi:HTH-type transcriptional repressor of NAD biosynthesis genes
VDELHIIMGYDDTRDRELFEDSAMSQQPTVPIACAGCCRPSSIRKIFVFMPLMKRGWSLIRTAGTCGAAGLKPLWREGHCA